MTREQASRKVELASSETLSPGKQSPKAEAPLAQNLSQVPAARRPDAVMKMQRQIGNAATLRQIQRDGVKSVSMSGSDATWNPPQTVWKAPFNLGDVKTRGDAVHRLDDMSVTLNELKDHMPKNEQAPFSDVVMLTQRHMVQLTQSVSSEVGASVLGSDLTNDDIKRLDSLSVQAQNVASAAAGRASRLMHGALEKIETSTKTIDLEEVQSQLREEMKINFLMNKSNPDVMEKMRKTLLKTFLVQVKVAKVTGWARDLRDLNDDLNSMLALSGTKPDRSKSIPTVMKSYANKARDGVLKMLQVTEAWHGLTTIFGSRTNDLPEPMQLMEQFKARLDLMDAGMPFLDAIPVIGDIWFDVYSTFTRKLISVLEKMYELQLREEVDTANHLDMRETSKNKNGVPLIPTQSLHLFPGGQPIFDFMYGLVNEDEADVAAPQMGEKVTTFFHDYRERFDVGLTNKKDKMPVQSASQWYNPNSWRDVKVNPDLIMYWIRDNKEVIWAQLYGNLPQRL